IAWTSPETWNSGCRRKASATPLPLQRVTVETTRREVVTKRYRSAIDLVITLILLTGCNAQSQFAGVDAEITAASRLVERSLLRLDAARRMASAASCTLRARRSPTGLPGHHGHRRIWPEIPCGARESASRDPIRAGRGGRPGFRARRPAAGPGPVPPPTLPSGRWHAGRRLAAMHCRSPPRPSRRRDRRRRGPRKRALA